MPKTDTVDYRIINFVTVFSAIASWVTRRRLKITADAATKAEEGTLYGPGIDDSV